MALNEQIAEWTNSSKASFANTDSLTVQSVPGTGATLGVEFLAAFAGVAPAPRAPRHGLVSTPTSPEGFHVEANQARSAPA